MVSSIAGTITCDRFVIGPTPLVPAKAGTQSLAWIPAYSGMTGVSWAVATHNAATALTSIKNSSRTRRSMVSKVLGG
jgi:hypothetical protein